MEGNEVKHDSLPGTHTVQCLQDAVQKPDWSSKVSAAAGCFGTLAVLAVSAAYGDTMQSTPTASQVAPIKVEVSDKTLLELKIDPNRYEQFSKLGTYQGGVLLFLDGLKKASNLPAGNPNKLTVDLKKAAEDLIWTFTVLKKNTDAGNTMKLHPEAIEGVFPIQKALETLRGYANSLPSDPYQLRFNEVSKQISDTFAFADNLRRTRKAEQDRALASERQGLATDKTTRQAAERIAAFKK